MQPPVVWLASYPKSGNTWFRFALFHLLHGRMPATSRELDAVFNSRLPVTPGERLKKSHAHKSVLEAEMSAQDKVIYIVRHPLDVMQSSLNYAVLNGETGVASTCRQGWIDAFIDHAGHLPWSGPPYSAGSWNDNVEGWISDLSGRVLVIRYEDALRNSRTILADCAKFLALEVSSASIEACADATAFDRLRAFEERELETARKLNTPQGRFSIPPRLAAAETGARFFNKGKSGTYRDILSADHILAAWERFQRVATKLGYTLSPE